MSTRAVIMRWDVTPSPENAERLVAAGLNRLAKLLPDGDWDVAWEPLTPKADGIRFWATPQCPTSWRCD